MMWWLAQNALGAAALAACVALITRFVRLSPSAKHALWLVVIIKLIAPPLPIWSWPTPASAPTLGVAPLVTSTGTLIIPRALAAFAWDAVAALWIAGAVGMVILQGIRLYRLHVAIRRGKTPPGWMVTEARSLAEQLRVTAPRIVTISNSGSPLLVTGLRPVLVVPEPLLRTLDRSAWRSALAHELVHLKRRDHWTGWVELVTACVWWWNPVFWCAWRRLHENAEYACDAWVVRLLPEGRRSYAESLISIVDTLSWNTVPVGAIGMAAGGKRAFERRLEMILRDAVPHRMSHIGTALAFALTLAVLPGWAQPKSTAVETAGVPAVYDLASAQSTADLPLSTDAGESSAANTQPVTPTAPEAASGVTRVTVKSDASPKALAASNTVRKVVKLGREQSEPAPVNVTLNGAKSSPQDKSQETAPTDVTRQAPSGAPESTPETETAAQPGLVRTEKFRIVNSTSKTTLADAAVTPESNGASRFRTETVKSDGARADVAGGLQKVEVHGSTTIRFNRYSWH